MLSIRLIKKLSSNAVGADEIAELLSSMGIDLEVAHIAPEDVPGVFQDAALRTMKPGAVVITLSGRLKNGDRLDALMIVQPKEQPAMRLSEIERKTFETMERHNLSPEPA